MFQCIIQQKNGWIHPHNTETKDVFPDIRIQLNEQLKCLDLRMETQVALVTELQDFFRRRGELELDYSKNLDKLAKSLQLRHKEQKQKREQWPLFSSYACWQQLVTQTKNLSRDHGALSEVYSTHLVNRLSQVMEDVQRIYKRCREIGYETHEEILRVLHELHTTMKTYHSYQAELKQAEVKLTAAESQRSKLEQSLSPDKWERSKKYKLIEKEVMKVANLITTICNHLKLLFQRNNKYTDAKVKALKARNEYVLCLETSNTTIHKYFVDDLSDLIDCMDFGFHNCISRALLMHVSAEEGRQKSVQTGLDTLLTCINSLDSRLDKQRFLECNHSAFMIPKKLEFQTHRPEEVVRPEIQKVLHQEMETRLNQLQQRVTSLKIESDEVWKTLETAESTLLEMLNAKDYDCSAYFGETAVPGSKPPETISIKLRADRQETEDFYLSKFREYLLGSTRIARLDAKQEYMRQSLLAESCPSTSTLKSIVKTPRRKRIGRLQMSGQPKLFGGSLEEYLEATNQEIPLIIKSSIRVINLYGLHHQGIFRVSGSQVEINNFREWFERGEDPLADMTDASDINSVAGVLKLYLRELREPLFPIIYFEHFMELAQLESKREFVIKMKELVQSLPRPIMIVMRYIFAFLNHLSDFSDENMMDPYNLAICFGPTLVPVPDDKDQVQYQNQVNELIKNIIMFNDDIFPSNGGIIYEKYISPEPEDHDVGDSPLDNAVGDIHSQIYPSEDDSETVEATAQFDFMARSDRELSLKKGDLVTLYLQVSNDWWKGAVGGQEGLIPDKYISLKIKDDDREKLDNLKSSSSDESMRRRASSSNDSILSESSVSINSPSVQCAPITWKNASDLSDPVHNSSSSVPLNHSREVGHVRYKPTESASTDIQSFLISPAENVISHNTAVNLMKFLSNRTSDILNSKKCAVETDVSPQVSPQDKSLQEDYSHFSSTEQDVFDDAKSELVEVDKSIVNFSQNRKQWQRRANSQSNVNLTQMLKLNRQSERIQRQNYTPDLVMDLPLISSSSPKELTKKSITHTTDSVDIPSEEDTTSLKSLESPTGPDSPDMQTAAERFAKQNQCTLKKNTKILVDASTVSDINKTDVQISGPIVERKSLSRPQVKVKPPVLKKPTFTVAIPVVSTENARQDQSDLPT
ncbi:hypothetical protein FQA39_LY09144 [Lamprigera yunnana]|nr:hypothetical protein FQA39_LY09144 [Lamprigera yunnana]